jgi:hypothetical protein
MKGITANCIIRDRVVLKDGEIVLTVAGAATGTGGTGMGEFLVSLYQHSGLNYPRFYKMDLLSKLGWLAAEILLKDSFRAENYRPEEVGIVLANANSSLDTDLKYFETVAAIPSPSLFVYTLPSIVIGEICIRNNFKGETAFFVADRFDADFMEGYVRGLMKDNIFKACIYGWVDLLGEVGEAVLFLMEKENG